MNSELSLDDKQYLIDVARPNPDTIPPNDLNYRMPDSELILEHLLIVAHEGESADLREIMMTIDSEKFNQAGHSSMKLADGIFQAYKDVYQNTKKAMIMLQANIKTVDNLLHRTIYHDKKDGHAMLLVMVFYMGIDDGGRKIVTKEQA
jgi:hypothetical protein